MKLIYVASPYAGDVEKHVEYAKQACRAVMESGHAFFAPHLLYPSILDDNVPEERQLGIDMGLTMLEKCDELWTFGDHISKGMQAEIKEAERIGIPVRHIALELQIADSKEKLEGMTVEQFLRTHPNATSDIMTQGGYVYITPEQIDALLGGGQIGAHAGTSDSWRVMEADELLGQVICSIRQVKSNYFSMLTDWPEQIEKQKEVPDMSQSMQM